jgi:Spy/CpxP family protein refolding chaperone
MKRIGFLAVLVLVIGSAAFVMAEAGKKEGSMKRLWGMDDSLLSTLSFTTEQLEKVRILDASYQKDIAPLRSQFFEKKTELRLLWREVKLDPIKIKALEREIHELMGRLREKSTDYRLTFRDILTPEQAAKFVALVGAMDHRERHGRH